MRIATAAFAALLLGLPMSTFGADVAPSLRAAWTPSVAYDPLETQLRYVEALLDRELGELAALELERVDVDSLSEASEANAGLFGVDSVRTIVENAKLSSVEGRAQASSALEALREKTPNAGFRKGACKEAIAYELAYVRALYSLGTIAAESAAIGAEEDKPVEFSEEASQYLAKAASYAQQGAETLTGESVRPFLFWYAKSTLANGSDAKRFDKAEKVAAALEKASNKQLDEYYFYARLLLIESARERGELERASTLIAETLRAFKEAEKNPDAPIEIALGLLAEETKLLAAEGKEEEALKTAAQDVDLLDSPLPNNLGRFAEYLPDLFTERDLTSASVFWQSSKNAPDESELETISNLPTKQALIEAAKLASANARGAVARARASIMAQLAGASSSDWTTLEVAANESYRNGDLEEALASYDRAAEEANASGDSDASYRLRSVAAGIVDKICRDKLYEDYQERASDVWEKNAKERFEALAKDRPNEKLAPSFYLLALEHASNAGEDRQTLDTARLEYLRLFPEANDRAAFALDLARRLAAAGRCEEAYEALDRISPDDPEFIDAIEVTRNVYETQPQESRDLAAYASRLLDMTTFAESAQASSLAETAERLQKSAKRISPTTFTLGDSAILSAIVEASLEDDARLDADYAAALETTLDSWEKAAQKETLGKIQAYRLSLALDTKTPDELVALLKSTNGSTSGAALDAIERVAASAEDASPKKRKQLAQFALDSLDSLGKDAVDADRVALVRADALRMLDKTQESLNLYAALRKKNAKNARAIKGIATLLTAQKDAKIVEQALKYWSDYADLTPTGSREWWDAKERCVEIYCRLGKKEQAEKTLKTLWLTRSDPTDPERKARWEKMVR